jgi:hypothetical protein
MKPDIASKSKPIVTTWVAIVPSLPSIRRTTAVGGDRGARDHPRFVVREEQHDRRDVLGLAHPERVGLQLLDDVLPVGRGARPARNAVGATHALGVDASGGDAVDPHVAQRVGARQRTRERDDRTLRGSVDVRGVRAAQPRSGRHVHHRAATGVDDPRDHVPARVHRSLDVEHHRPVPHGHVDLGDRRILGQRAACAAEQRVDPAEACDRRLDRGRDAGILADVGVHEERLAALLGHARHDGAAGVGIAIGDHDASPLAGEQHRGRGPDTGACAGDEAHPALHPPHAPSIP